MGNNNSSKDIENIYLLNKYCYYCKNDNHTTGSCVKLEHLYKSNNCLKRITKSLGLNLWTIRGHISFIDIIQDKCIILKIKGYKQDIFYFEQNIDIKLNDYVTLLIYPIDDMTPSQMDTFLVFKISNGISKN